MVKVTEGELQRELALLGEADFAAVPEVPNSSHFLESWPKFQKALDDWKVTFHGKYFTVYHRRRVSHRSEKS